MYSGIIFLFLSFIYPPLFIVAAFFWLFFFIRVHLKKQSLRTVTDEQQRKNDDYKKLVLGRIADIEGYIELMTNNIYPNLAALEFEKEYLKKGYKILTFKLPDGTRIAKIHDWDGENVKCISEIVYLAQMSGSEPENLIETMVAFNKSSMEQQQKHYAEQKNREAIDKELGISNKIKNLLDVADKFSLEDYCPNLDMIDNIIKSDIQKYSFATKEEYFAQKEKELRSQERQKYLATSYAQRTGRHETRKRLASIDSLHKLSPTDFEKWVKENIFEKSNWTVEETRITGDGGVDLVLYKGDEKSIAQCKRFKGTVGEPMLRDFYGTMFHEGVSRGFFITTGLYSLPALKFAEDKPIEMIDRRILANKYL